MTRIHTSGYLPKWRRLEIWAWLFHYCSYPEFIESRDRVCHHLLIRYHNSNVESIWNAVYAGIIHSVHIQSIRTASLVAMVDGWVRLTSHHCHQTHYRSYPLGIPKVHNAFQPNVICCTSPSKLVSSCLVGPNQQLSCDGCLEDH